MREGPRFPGPTPSPREEVHFVTCLLSGIHLRASSPHGATVCYSEERCTRNPIPSSPLDTPGLVRARAKGERRVVAIPVPQEAAINVRAPR